jgi:2-keto-4-pentenoate hydratase
MPTDLERTIETCAARIFDARRSRTSIPPVRSLLPEKDMASAYAIQTTNNRRLDQSGARRVGRKIGLTSEAVQRQLGVDQPDFGVLFDFMDYGGAGADVSAGSLIAPRIEAEIAFRLARDIDRKGLGREELEACIELVAPAAEIVDSAIAAWDINIVDTIADNASCGAYVVGAWQAYARGLDLPGRQMRMTRDGEEISKGAGAASLGDPLNALAWLADTAVEFGAPLRGGEVVLSGALGPMVPLTPGAYVIEIDGFATHELTVKA